MNHRYKGFLTFALVLSAFLISFLDSSGTAAAGLVNQSCIGGVEQYLIYNGAALVWNSTNNCTYGCAYDGLSCNSPGNVDTNIYIAAIISVLGFAFVMVLIGHVIKDEWGVLPLFFYMFAFIFCMGALSILGFYFSAGQNNIERSIANISFASMLMFAFFLAYVFVRIFVKVLGNILAIKNTENRGRHP